MLSTYVHQYRSITIPPNKLPFIWQSKRHPVKNPCEHNFDLCHAIVSVMSMSYTLLRAKDKIKNGRIGGGVSISVMETPHAYHADNCCSCACKIAYKLLK